MTVAEAIRDLAAVAPGPALAAALAGIDLAVVPNDRMVEVLRAQQRQLSHEQARMAAVIAEVGVCTPYPDPGEVSRADAPQCYAPQETRAALRLTRTAAECEHAMAEVVVFRMPAVFGAWSAGEIDRARVRVFVRYLEELNDAQIAKVCQTVVPRAPRLTTGQLAVLLRRAVLRIDPESADKRYRKALRERTISGYLAEDGTATITMNGLATDEADAACARVQQVAEAARRAGHPGRIGQIRVDLVLGLMDGRFHLMTHEQIVDTLIADYAARLGREASASAGADDDQHGADPGEQSAGLDHPGEPADQSQTDPAEAGASQGGVGQNGVGQNGSGQNGGGQNGDARVGIEIRVGLGTVLGLDEYPGDLPGWGPVLATDARIRVQRQRRAEWRFAVTDTAGFLEFEGVTRCRPDDAPRGGPPGGIVELHVPAALLAELATAPAEVLGQWAPVVADIAAQYADRAGWQDRLDAHPDARFPSAALRRSVQIRDRTCRFPGCRYPASAADQDHTIEVQRDGKTVRVNLGPLCPYDHRVKHDGGWRVRQPEPGLFVWTSPLGQEYSTRGEWLEPELPEPEPGEPDPDWDDTGTKMGGPIINRTPPPPPREPPPARPPVDPDEPPPF